MRVDCSSGYALSVQVRDETDAPLPELQHHGQRYVVGASGSTFTVFVHHELGARGYHAHTLDVRLFVDGVCCGSSLLLEPGKSGTFTGFYVRPSNNHARPGPTGSFEAEVRTFKMVAPTIVAPGESRSSHTAASNNAAGTLQIKATPVRVTGTSQPRSNSHNLPGSVQQSKAADNKKFFMKPSLGVAQGSVVRQTFGTDTTVELGSAVANVTIRYETAQILVLRKVLNLDLAAHRAILERFTEREEEQEEEEAPVPAGTIDLTAVKADVDMSRPMKVNGRVLGTDEFATCDLTDDRPAWTTNKRPKIELD